MLLVSVSCLMTVVVLSMHYKGSHGREMPLIIRTIFFDYIAKFFCMNTVRKRANSRSIHPVSVRLFLEGKLYFFLDLLMQILTFMAIYFIVNEAFILNYFAS